MQVRPILAFSDNYIWHIVDEYQGKTICVDPGDAKPVLDFLQHEGLALSAILITHHHDDHVGGVAELLKHFPQMMVYGPEDKRISKLIKQSLRENDTVTFASCHLKVLETPGHTVSHISYYEPIQGWLFCGDTLFSAGCGRIFDGSIEALYDSLQKLKDLPEETKIYCAHEYTQQNLRFAATVEPDNIIIRNHAHKLLSKDSPCSLPSNIALEKQINPFLRTEILAHSISHSQTEKLPDSLSLFKQFREKKDNFY